jgi:FtsH-binding integral membrane protein
MGDFLVGAWVAILGFVGLFLAAGAADSEMSVFGWGLVIFAVLFDFNLIKRHFDKLDEARAKAKVDKYE